MRILVTGADGQVGREFPESARNIDSEISVVGAGRSQLDITNKSQIENIFKEMQPSIIVNAAAYTAVDKAEEEIDVAFAVNRDGSENLAEVCAANDVPLIQISTDYVFDGNKQGEYLETDAVNPMSVYGKSKLEGEQRIQAIWEKHIILRTSWVFGPYGNNFVYTIVRLAKQKPELKVVNDQFGCPTSAFSIASAILRICSMIEKDGSINWGVYHYCGSPSTNWFEFSKAIIENSQSAQDYCLKCINPVPTSEYPTAAVRPKNSVMNCSKIHEVFGVSQQSWLDGLRDMLKHPEFAVQST